jgi:hypothetical protein
MEKVTERRQLRREYLRKKARQRLYMVCGVVTVLFGYALTCMMRGAVLEPVKEHPDLPTTLRASFVAVCVMAFYGLLVYGANRMIKSAQKIQVQYVPPVTADTLPADEILVRGSEEPPIAQNAVLLRAAKGQETPAEELLRDYHPTQAVQSQKIN